MGAELFRGGNGPTEVEAGNSGTWMAVGIVSTAPRTVNPREVDTERIEACVSGIGYNGGSKRDLKM